MSEEDDTCSDITSKYQSNYVMISHDTNFSTDTTNVDPLMAIYQKLCMVENAQRQILSRIDYLEQSKDLPKTDKWSSDEHLMYLRCLETIPRSNVSQIAQVLCTKTAKQVTAHQQKFYQKLERHYQKERPDASQTVDALKQSCKLLNQQFAKDAMSLLNSQNSGQAIANPHLCKPQIQTFLNQVLKYEIKFVLNKLIQLVGVCENINISVKFVSDKLQQTVEEVVLVLIYSL
ncbi:Myb-like_DNA-binding domain-containing protein [Hexamita inflata]|uniref:Myb-like DNA-binding domain-containing protein n=1 Tax=Hexamita inflata TaxID=28002 RepID=A0AA86P680_9EUKA|nr:Myb-like DNA-binding domain-containing protein [Hexamita inflata]